MRSHRAISSGCAKDTAYLTPQAEALTEPLRQTTEDLGLGDLDDEALHLWNVLFDPRDTPRPHQKRMHRERSGRPPGGRTCRAPHRLGHRGHRRWRKRQWTMCVIPCGAPTRLEEGAHLRALRARCRP
ncbi:hypothetical protein LV779_02635 [Streptomyces thinghirensis]|nr:hypothetical protein [Streptomyces thinghirensis]